MQLQAAPNGERTCGTARNRNYGYSIWEMEVFGAPMITQNIDSISSSDPTTTISLASSVTLATGFDNTNTTFAGVISGTNGSLVKAGTGVFTLTNANAYAGGTTISAGTIRANSSSQSLGTGAVTIASGGTLGGMGSVGNGSNLLTVNSGGTITAGMDAAHNGILTTGNQSWNGGGSYLWKITAAGSGGAAPATGNSGALGAHPGVGAGTEGANWDLLNVSGAGGLNLSSLSSSSRFTIAPAGAITSSNQTYSWVIAQVAGQNSITLPTGYLPNQDLTNGGSASGAFALSTSNFTDASNSSVTASNFTLEAVNFASTEDLVLDYNATPEPGTVLLVLAGAMPIFSARRRRRRQV